MKIKIIIELDADMDDTSMSSDGIAEQIIKSDMFVGSVICADEFDITLNTVSVIVEKN